MESEKTAFKILIVEDEPGLQQALKTAIGGQKKYEVLQAFDGEEGMKLAKEKLPNLILLDIILPKKGGFELLNELRADKDTLAIPVIVLTNLESGGDIEKATSLGVQAYLVKADYTLDEIVERIARLAEEYYIKQ